MSRTYRYYPGCSLKTTASSYEESLLAVATAIGIEMRELDDWNCCGATAYFSIREIVTHAISARNLAIAEKEGADIVAPCNACYMGLNKSNQSIQEFPDVKRRVDDALAAAGLEYNGTVRVRHLLEVFLNDVGTDRLKSLVKKPLEGLKVAGYTGCQMVRPLEGFDDMEVPKTLDLLASAMGATPVKFQMAARCCGGSHMLTDDEMALRMCRAILLCARENQADVIVTTCPLCQLNLDAFQGRVNSMFGTDFDIPILFFTQLMGVAMGVGPLGLGRNIVKPGKSLARFE